MNKVVFVAIPSLIGIYWLPIFTSNDNPPTYPSSILEEHQQYAPYSEPIPTTQELIPALNSVKLTSEEIAALSKSGKGFSTRVTKYGHSLENNKYLYGGDVSEELGSKRISIIEDYTIKLYFSCGSYGTGWFLDYELPKDGQKYPTKWFIATNAHVIKGYRFRDNKFNQKLPVPYFSHRACVARGNLYTDLFLFKEARDEDIVKTKFEGFDRSKDPEEWLASSIKTQVPYYFESRDAGVKYADNSINNTNLYQYKVSDAKLFYVPIDFLGEKYLISDEQGVNQHYHVDFAVLEVDFPNETIAKTITDNFYNKIQSKKTEELNFFSEELLSTKGSDELEEAKESFFIAGYPGNSKNQFKVSGNYSYKHKRASKLTFVDWTHWNYLVKNHWGEPIIGHMDIGKLEIRANNLITPWYGGGLRRWGYNYLLDNMPFSFGSSGSLVTDSKGDVLGIYDFNFYYRGGVAPLRSKGFYDGKRLIYPAYDLITGVPGQVESYKSQLDRYYPGMKTNLRSKWEAR